MSPLFLKWCGLTRGIVVCSGYPSIVVDETSEESMPGCTLFSVEGIDTYDESSDRIFDLFFHLFAPIFSSELEEGVS